jgi:tetratricopeptide (TPR) repeat protein
MTTDLRDRYNTFIETIIQITLQGKVRSKEQLYNRLRDELEPGTSEVFDAALTDRLAALEAQINAKDLQTAKATRALRAVRTLEAEWHRYQQDNQAQDVLSSTLFAITSANNSDRLEAFVTRLDPNHPEALTDNQLQQLALGLQQSLMAPEVQIFGQGIQRGMTTWANLQPHLISWLFASPDTLGFQNDQHSAPSPWKLWSQHSQGFPQGLFQTLATESSIEDWIARQPITTADWLELTITLQRLQQGLIAWATTQIYSNKLMAKFLSSLYVGFAGTWILLSRGVGGGMNVLSRDMFAQTAMRSGLQVLRLFAQQPFFPFYGNLTIGFGGQTFRSTMEYFSEPLRTVEGTQVKARILTLMGNFVRIAGTLEEATAVYTQALEIAQAEGDRPCQIANLNHLSRTLALARDYEGAIAQGQRALILSRDSGDALGEANALTNLGYGEVLAALAREAPPEDYEIPMGYLEQGTQKALRLEDPQSEAFSTTSLGIAHLSCGDPTQALVWIQQGLDACGRCGDAYLQSVNLLSMAEACYQLDRFEDAPYPALLALYHLYHLGAREWRQAAGLITLLQGRQSQDWQSFLLPERGAIVEQIGPEGVDSLADILEGYRLGE